MKYYGIHNFTEKLIGNNLEFNNGIFNNSIKLPSYLANISKYLVFIDYNNILFVDYNNNINLVPNADMIIPLVGKIECLFEILFKESSLLNFSSNIIEYNLENNIFNTQGIIYVNLSKKDLTQGIFINNLKINYISIDGTIVYPAQQELNILIDLIYNNIIQTKVSIIDTTHEYCYNILFNNLSISFLYNNLFSISGSLKSDNTNLLNLIDLDSTIIQALDVTNNVTYPISIEDNNLKTKLFYNKNIEVLDHTTLMELSTEIPYHRHTIDTLNINKNVENGLLYIDSQRSVSPNKVIYLKNIKFKNHDFIYDLTNLNYNNIINIYKNVTLFIQSLSINTDITYYDETIGNNIYYYITGSHIDFNLNLNWGYNKQKELDVTLNVRFIKDNSNLDIITFFDSKYLILTLNCNKTGIKNLDVNLIDKTSIIPEEKIILSPNLDITYVIGVYEFKIIQDYPTDIPQFGIFNRFDYLSKINEVSIFEIPKLTEIKLYDNKSVPICIDKANVILYVTSNIPSQQDNKYLTIKYSDHTTGILDLLLNYNNLTTVQSILLLNNSYSVLTLNRNVIHIFPPADSISNEYLSIYLIE